MSNIQIILKERKSKGLLRELKHEIKSIDFCSNDYLGFSRSTELNQSILNELNIVKNGATGSRLLSGNSNLYTDLEQEIAQFHHAETALIYSSGYQANVGLLQCIAQKGDTLILDELAHASLIDGARLSHAKRFKFKHNDIIDLEQKLNNSTGNVYVVVESLYSMNGDFSDLITISNICKKYGANLIVDEAHSGGIFGKNGTGLVSELNLQENVFARIITYGKAFGVHGATILGSTQLKDYLINFSRSFIYSTGLPPYQLIAIKKAYQKMLVSESTRKKLFDNIQYFKSKTDNSNWIKSNSPIQSIIIPGNQKVKEVGLYLQQNKLEAFPILSPTVAEGTERIRFCIHSFNTSKEIDQLFATLNTIL